MRKRHPGFYVSVPPPASGFGAAETELFDGPWPTQEAAERRAAKINKDRARPTTIVKIAEDGMTVVREPESF